MKYSVYKDEDGIFYSDGVLSDNGEYHTIKFLNSSTTKWAVVFPLDTCTIACTIIGEIYDVC